MGSYADKIPVCNSGTRACTIQTPKAEPGADCACTPPGAYEPPKEIKSINYIHGTAFISTRL